MHFAVMHPRAAGTAHGVVTGRDRAGAFKLNISIVCVVGEGIMR